jgi:alpha-methylacyl-CoA racemase
LELKPSDLPGDRNNKADWPKLKDFFTEVFKKKTRDEWASIFDGTDACCTPVLTQQELEAQGFDQRPAVTLKSSPGLAIHEGEDSRPAAVGQGIGVEGSGWIPRGLKAGDGGEGTLATWTGWSKGRQFVDEDGLLGWKDSAKL